MRRDEREAVLRRVRALLELDRVEAATADVRRALASAPDDPELLATLGLCQIRAHDPAAARRTLAEARAAAPDHGHAAYLAGFAARDDGDLDAAEAGYRDALRLAPEEPVYLRALAELCADRKRYAEALELARRAVAVAPERAANHLTLGFAASSAGDTVGARAAYEAALALDPTYATAWNNLGCVALAEGDRLGARERFREALRLDPESARARRNLALVVRARPPAIYESFDAFLGEVLRDLADAGRLGPPLRALALAQSVGKGALSRALTDRLAAGSGAGRIGVAAGTALAGTAVGALGRVGVVPLAALGAVAGAGWLATSRRLTPLRRRFAAHVATARARWESLHADWLDGRLSRQARETETDRLVETLAHALDREDTDAKE